MSEDGTALITIGDQGAEYGGRLLDGDPDKGFGMALTMVNKRAESLPEGSSLIVEVRDSRPHGYAAARAVLRPGTRLEAGLFPHKAPASAPGGGPNKSDGADPSPETTRAPKRAKAPSPFRSRPSGGRRRIPAASPFRARGDQSPRRRARGPRRSVNEYFHPPADYDRRTPRERLLGTGDPMEPDLRTRELRGRTIRSLGTVPGAVLPIGEGEPDEYGRVPFIPRVPAPSMPIKDPAARGSGRRRERGGAHPWRIAAVVCLVLAGAGVVAWPHIVTQDVVRVCVDDRSGLRAEQSACLPQGAEEYSYRYQGAEEPLPGVGQSLPDGRQEPPRGKVSVVDAP